MLELNLAHPIVPFKHFKAQNCFWNRILEIEVSDEYHFFRFIWNFSDMET